MQAYASAEMAPAAELRLLDRHPTTQRRHRPATLLSTSCWRIWRISSPRRSSTGSRGRRPPPTSGSPRAVPPSTSESTATAFVAWLRASDSCGAGRRRLQAVLPPVGSGRLAASTAGAAGRHPEQPRWLIRHQSTACTGRARHLPPFDWRPRGLLQGRKRSVALANRRRRDPRGPQTSRRPCWSPSSRGERRSQSQAAIWRGCRSMAQRAGARPSRHNAGEVWKHRGWASSASVRREAARRHRG
jgi:hypothetical protein